MDACSRVILPFNPNQKLVKDVEGNDLADIPYTSEVLDLLCAWSLEPDLS